MNPAQSAALEKEKSQNTRSPNTPPPGSGYGTPVEQMLAHYNRHQVTLPTSKWELEIQALPPGDYLTVYGSAFNTLMTAAGLDPKDEAERSRFQEQMTPRQRASIAESNLMNFRRIVAKAIISVPVSMDEQYICPPGVVSIYQIADSEIVFVNKEVEKLSGWAADVNRFQKPVSEA